MISKIFKNKKLITLCLVFAALFLRPRVRVL